MGLRMRSSDRFTGQAGAVGLRTSLWGPLVRGTAGAKFLTHRTQCWVVMPERPTVEVSVAWARQLVDTQVARSP